MPGQTHLANEQYLKPIQLETDGTIHSALSEHVASRSNTRLLYTGLGFAVLMLIGVSAIAIRPYAEQRTRSRTAHVVCYNGGCEQKTLSPASHVSSVPAVAFMHSGSRQRSTKVMYWLDGSEDRQEVGKIEARLRGVRDRPAPQLQRQTAPSPPSPPALPPFIVDTDATGGAAFRQHSDPEVVKILGAWIARMKVYCLSDQFPDPEGLAPVYKATLQQLAAFHSFALAGRASTPSTSRASAADQKVLYGLYSNNHNKLVAMVGGHFSSPGRSLRRPFARGKLKIEYISVNPEAFRLPTVQRALKKRKPSSFGLPVVQFELGELAKSLAVKLVIDTGNGDRIIKAK